MIHTLSPRDTKSEINFLPSILKGFISFSFFFGGGGADGWRVGLNSDAHFYTKFKVGTAAMAASRSRPSMKRTARRYLPARQT